VVIDIDHEGPECFEHISRINRDYRLLRLILVGDFKNTVFPEDIPRIFYFVRKPFEQAKLLEVVHSAFTKAYDEEKRREPRVSVELPVELIFKSRFFRTRTTNLSLHGMQAVWDDNGSLDEISGTYTDGESPFSACRLFLADDDDFGDSHINISLDLRYIRSNDPTLMGFEFRDLDLDLRTRLQEVVIW
jgi:hypothetical protein